MEKSINELGKVLQEYKQLGIQDQIDHKKFYLYSIITRRLRLLGDQGGPEKGKVDQKGGPETKTSILQLIRENESITSIEMSNRLEINRSATPKYLKKMQEENIIRREGSQKSGRWVIIK